MINPSQQEPIDNEEDIITEQIRNKKITSEPENDDDYQIYKKGATFNVGDAKDTLKISMNGSEGATSRQSPLRICLNR